MATDGPDPPPCNKKLYRMGSTPIICDTKGACAFEKLISGIRETLGVEVDWHYAGGRAVVKCWPKDSVAIGDAVESACKQIGLHTLRGES